MRDLVYTVPEGTVEQRVERVLRAELHLSKSLLRSLKWKPGSVMKNGVPVPVCDTARAGDRISVILEERRPPSPFTLACPFPLDIVFEDEDLLVLNKPPFLPMHDKSGPSMAAALRDYLGQDTVPHFVNRLDRGTSGLCVAAKSGYVHNLFRRMLHTDAFRREYRAIAMGSISPPQGVIALPIGPVEGDFRARCVRPDGQSAYTEYTALAFSARYTLLRLDPRTGRTHQLRVHLSASGHPLAGDTLYGAPADPAIARPALHSVSLRFTHPMSNQPVAFTVPPPEDMAPERFGFDDPGAEPH